MRKLVNGKVVDVKNIELFELAAEGLALSNTTMSSTEEGLKLSDESKQIQTYIMQYDIFFKSLPYPLYAIESPIKYVTIGCFIKALAKDHVRMWVDNGLNILIDTETEMTLNVVNNTWAVKYVTEPREDNVDMTLYKESIGYKEFSWILSKVLHREQVNFYEYFMKDFVEACNNDDMVMAWELENVLNFASVPNKMALCDNKIVDLVNKCEYAIDIYATKTVDIEDEKTTTWNLTNMNRISSITKPKQMKVYGFDVYTKSLSSEAFKFKDMNEKLTKTDLAGMQSLFLTLTGMKSSQELSSFPVYRGIIVNGYMAYIVDKSLFITKANRIGEAEEIARNIEFYGADRGMIFFTRTKRVNDRVVKECLYSCSVADKNIKLCKIQYKY